MSASPASYVTLPQQIAMIRFHLQKPATSSHSCGTLVDVVDAACDSLGLSKVAPLVERAAQCYDALYSHSVPSQPSPSDLNQASSHLKQAMAKRVVEIAQQARLAETKRVMVLPLACRRPELECPTLSSFAFAR